MCILADLEFADDLVMVKKPVLMYLLTTYKMSQNHLKLFFGAVPGCVGWNNNPTTCQLVAAYKQLLMRHNIEGGCGNCHGPDDTKILNAL